LPHEAIERIRLMQPFLIPQQGPSGLEVLSTLSNQDKHRVPIRANLTLHQLRFDGVKIAFENEDDIPDPPFRVSFLGPFRGRRGAGKMGSGSPECMPFPP
jgi:hypothetical protein